jgi:prepilin-type N-terminal cleavage/methylation domain-containing protein
VAKFPITQLRYIRVSFEIHMAPVLPCGLSDTTEPNGTGKPTMHSNSNKTKLSSSAGFTIVELLIVAAVMGIVCSIAVIMVAKSNRSLSLAGSMRALSVYMEKARVDSVRRHGVATINLNSASSYTVSIDSDGDGTPTVREISLPGGMSLSYSLPPATTSIVPSDTPITITYDWRGRTANTVLLTLVDSTSGVASSTLSVGPAGDISVDTHVTGPVTAPVPQNTIVATTTGIKTMH